MSMFLETQFYDIPQVQKNTLVPPHLQTKCIGWFFSFQVDSTLTLTLILLFGTLSFEHERRARTWQFVAATMTCTVLHSELSNLWSTPTSASHSFGTTLTYKGQRINWFFWAWSEQQKSRAFAFAFFFANLHTKFVIHHRLENFALAWQSQSDYWSLFSKDQFNNFLLPPAKQCWGYFKVKFVPIICN